MSAGKEKMKRAGGTIKLLLLCAVFLFAAGQARADCSNPTGHERDIVYNNPYHTYQFCDGTSWVSMKSNVFFATTGGTGAPSGLSFTDLTGQPLNSVVSSNTATITGFTGTLVASVSGGGSPQISVNGGGWTTSSAISSGQTLQVRLTSSGTASTQLTATVTVGTTSANWHVTTRSGSLNVFLTYGVYAGSIGGLSNADADCQAEAGAAGYGGTYKAILSDDSTSAASRLTLSYPIVNAYNGSVVAASNLWSGSISNYIVSPSGSGSLAPVWTGTNPDGSSLSGHTCSNWSSSAAYLDGQCGGNGASGGGNWIQGCQYYGPGPCSGYLHLYCIQQ
jgi:hypothetical protein